MTAFEIDGSVYVVNSSIAAISQSQSHVASKLYLQSRSTHTHTLVLRKLQLAWRLIHAANCNSKWNGIEIQINDSITSCLRGN